MTLVTFQVEIVRHEEKRKRSVMSVKMTKGQRLQVEGCKQEACENWWEGGACIK